MTKIHSFIIAALFMIFQLAALIMGYTALVFADTALNVDQGRLTCVVFSMAFAFFFCMAEYAAFAIAYIVGYIHRTFEMESPKENHV